MHFGRFRRLSLLLIFLAAFSCGMLSSPKPAHAAFLSEAGAWAIHAAHWVAQKAENAAMWLLEKAENQLLQKGNRAAAPLFPTMVSCSGVPGGDSVPIVPKLGPPVGDWDYQEDVWWPRMITMMKCIMKETSMTNAANQAQTAALSAAEATTEHMAKMNDKKVSAAAHILDAENVLCLGASRSQGMAAGGILVSMKQIELHLEMSSIASGAHPLGQGMIEAAKLRYENRLRLGLCEAGGNKGANGAANICPKGKEKSANADQLFTNFTLPLTINETDKTKYSYIEYIEAFRNQLFPISMDVVPVHALKSGDHQAIQIADERATLANMLNVFISPFIYEQASRKGWTDVAGVEQFKELLTRMGYPTEKDGMPVGLIVEGAGARGKAKISLSAAEFIHYKLARQDTNFITRDVAKALGINGAGVKSIELQNQIDMAVLLYDIREEIKKTNLILGAMGAHMIKPDVERIQADINSIRTAQ